MKPWVKCRVGEVWRRGARLAQREQRCLFSLIFSQKVDCLFASKGERGEKGPKGDDFNGSIPFQWNKRTATITTPYTMEVYSNNSRDWTIFDQYGTYPFAVVVIPSHYISATNNGSYEVTHMKIQIGDYDYVTASRSGTRFTFPETIIVVSGRSEDDSYIHYEAISSVSWGGTTTHTFTNSIKSVSFFTFN